MKILFAEKIPKDKSFPEANEDIFVFDSELCRIALSDGASESFDSKKWAELLTSRFVQNPELNLEWLSDNIGAYANHFDLSQMSWAKQAAFERGSFATLLGIEQFKEHETIDVLAIGDSIAILLDGEKFVDSFPYVCAEEFRQRPELLSTQQIHNLFFSSPDFFTKHLKTWKIKDIVTPNVLCMTDALGEWALRKAQDGHPMWSVLSKIDNYLEFEALVLQEREGKNMRTDDTTLLRILFEI